MSDNRERLRRLLLLVPYVARKPGMRVAELARRLGVDTAELLEDLELLTLVGRPPFSPGDFIDIYVEGERVYVALDQRLSRPPRLTAPEAAALWASAQLMRPAARSALGAAQKKILAAVPAHSRKVFTGMSRRVGAEAAPIDDLLEPLTRAARELREVEFDYLAPGRQTGQRRTVRPYAVYLHGGQWYLAGFCVARGAERLFRVDRISGLEVTARTFPSRPEVRAAIGGPGGGGARLRFTARAAPWLREQYGDDAHPLPDGGLEIDLAGASPEWLVPYVLSFGGEAEVVAPESLRAAVLDAARRMRAGLEGESPVAFRLASEKA